MRFSNGFKISIVIILLFFAVVFANIFKQKEHNRQAKITYKHVEIPFVEPSNFSFWDFQEIQLRRMKAIDSCPLKPQYYHTRSEIYRGIDSKHPWFLTAGHYSSHPPTNTASPIVNPTMLVDFVHPFTFMNRPIDKTKDILNYTSLLSVSKIIYTPETNTIDVYYDMQTSDLRRLNKNLSKYPYRFSLTGINARDLGYEYVRAVKLENIRMLAWNNISNSMYKFKDYYGVGGRSYIEEGCYNNQILPHQPELDFRVTKLPARIKLRLYKNPKDKEYINYNLHFYNFLGADLHYYKKKASKLYPQVKKMSLDEFHAFYYENMEKIVNIKNK